jgi:hypothetical protein
MAQVEEFDAELQQPLCTVHIIRLVKGLCTTSW